MAGDKRQFDKAGEMSRLVSKFVKNELPSKVPCCRLLNRYRSSRPSTARRCLNQSDEECGSEKKAGRIIAGRDDARVGRGKLHANHY